MKKTLLSITAVLAALTMFFAACENPVTDPDSLTITKVTPIPEISGPEWVTPIAYPGVITVSWAFVKDAKSYTVYRQRTDGKDGLFMISIPATTNPQLIQDIVSPKNQLAEGAEYTYYVTANTSYADSGRETFSPDPDFTPVSQLLRDGATKATVTARVPARYSGDNVWQDVSVLLEGDQTLDAEKIAAEKVTTTANAEKLLLSWPHYNPGFEYTVSYDIGKALTLNTSIGSPDPDPTTALGTYAFYAVPLFGGENTARVVVTLGGDEYYYKPLTITKTLPAYTLDVLTKPAIGSVTRSATNARIVWTAVAGAPNPADYKLWRIKSPDVGTNQAYDSSKQITVTGDWETVTIGARTSHTGDTITVQDTGLALDTGYLYALYAETGGAKSAPSVWGVPAVSVPKTTVLDIQPYTVTSPSDPDVLTHPVTLGWTKQDGVDSYTLLRAPVTNYPSTTGDFVPVTIPAGQPDASGRYTITDTPAIRKSYKYRLVAHDAAGSTVVAEKDLNSDPFIDSVSSSLTVNSTNIGTAYAAQVEIGNPSAYLTDLYVDIYRAEVPANASPTPGSYQNVAVNSSAPAFTRIENGLSLKGNNLTYLDTGLTIGTNYIYRHVIKYGATASAAVELPNTAATASGDPVVDFTGYVQTASVPSASGGAVITQVSASSSGTNTMYYFTITGGTLTNLREATVQVQTRATTAAALTSWSAYSSITPGSIAYTTTSIAAGTVPANTYYFTITRPTAALPVTNDYRLVLVDQDGNVASYDAASATVLVNDTALGW